MANLLPNEQMNQPPPSSQQPYPPLQQSYPYPPQQECFYPTQQPYPPSQPTESPPSVEPSCSPSERVVETREDHHHCHHQHHCHDHHCEDRQIRRGSRCAIAGAALIATGLAFALCTMGFSLFLCLIGLFLLTFGCCEYTHGDPGCQDCVIAHHRPIEVVVVHNHSHEHC